MTLSEILPRLKNKRPSGEGWVACCPSHEDTHPSLSVSEQDGRLLLHCHAGCPFEEILRALGFGNSANGNAGVRKPDLTYNGGRSKANSGHCNKRLISRRPVAEYDYTNLSGELLYQVVRNELRYSDSSMEKTFVARRRPRGTESASRDGWVYNLDGVPLIPYNLCGIADASIVYVVEGEKDVESLKHLGLAATCNPFGAGKWRPEFSEALRGKTAVVLSDNDEMGRLHAESVAASLDGTANEVLVIHLPGLPAKGDVTDFIELGGVEDDLTDLVQRAEPWHPTSTNEPLRSRFVFTKLTDLINEPKEEVAFIWADTLPTAGFSICSAKPKVGKSTLARNLAIAIAKGEPFLGRATKNGKVLYLCLEEKRSEITNHFRKMLTSSDQVLVYTGSTPENALNELRIAIAEHEPDLVIIDPLSRVVRAADFNDYAQMSRALEPFIDLARATGCHILALHHDSKRERVGGDALLGSTALFATVDCHIQLRKREGGRTMLTTQRYGEDIPETVVELDKESGLIAAQGTLSEFVISNAKEEILNSIERDEEIQESVIKTRIETTPRGIISKAVRELFNEGKLKRNGDGVKGSPFLYSKATF